jgi:hypothetical protein
MKDFVDLLKSHDIIGTAESWLGSENCNIKGYVSFTKGCNKMEKFGRNLSSLIVYIKNNVIKRVKEIGTTIKEMLWIRPGVLNLQLTCFQHPTQMISTLGP